jgi:hypothetical protein
MSKTLDEREWSEYICEDLLPILMLLRQRHGAQVNEVIHDLKGIYTDVYLEEKIPGQAMEEVMREFSSNENLRFGDGSVACVRDYCSIGQKECQEKGRERSALTRLRDFALRVLQ